MSIVDMYEASIILGVPEFLVRDFVSYGFNQRKLKAVNTGSAAYQFSIEEVQDFRSHLEAPWSGNSRSSIPKHIERYLKYEAQGVCALCQTQQPHYEYAHIQPWATSRCHSPHNILYLCLNCHTSHGNDIKLLRGLKEEKLRRIRLLDSDFIYDCSKDMISGEAIYVFNGTAYHADARELDKIATGFIKTKVGNLRCTVQRYGVAVINGLQPGQDYYLSAAIPGKIVTNEEFEATRNPTVKSGEQRVGRAESNKHLAITLGEVIWYEPATP
jgi:hypothetical protein